MLILVVAHWNAQLLVLWPGPIRINILKREKTNEKPLKGYKSRKK